MGRRHGRRVAEPAAGITRETILLFLFIVCMIVLFIHFRVVVSCPELT